VTEQASERSRVPRDQAIAHAGELLAEQDLAMASMTRREQERTVDGMFVCQACRHIVRVLVDDGPLCLRCDAFGYPFDPPYSRAS
jgi:hypothetical protein